MVVGHNKISKSMNSDDIVEITMCVPEDSSTGNYSVVKVADNLYKLANNDPFNEKLTYGTVVSVSPYVNKDGVNMYMFNEIYAKSDYNFQVIGLPMSLTESELRPIGKMITDAGGYWEVIFGGMGYINLPKRSNLNVLDQINQLITSKLK